MSTIGPGDRELIVMFWALGNVGATHITKQMILYLLLGFYLKPQL